MTDQHDGRADRAALHYPTTLHHKHGLADWWPMLPERSAEPVAPGELLIERQYRCQFVGDGEVVSVRAEELRGAEAAATA